MRHKKDKNENESLQWVFITRICGCVKNFQFKIRFGKERERILKFMSPPMFIVSFSFSVLYNYVCVCR